MMSLQSIQRTVYIVKCTVQSELLHVAVEDNKSSQLVASIQALARMIDEDSSQGLSSYFLLSDSSSCLRIPNGQLLDDDDDDGRSAVESMFPSSAFTFMAWLRLDTSPNLGSVVASDIMNRMDSRMSSRLVSLNRHSKRRGGHLYYFEGQNGGKSFCELCSAVCKDNKVRVELRYIIEALEHYVHVLVVIYETGMIHVDQFECDVK